LQRGLQVYREVCSVCHGLKYIAFRNLADLGYNEDQRYSSRPARSVCVRRYTICGR
jgi:cytochrome c1